MPPKTSPEAPNASPKHTTYSVTKADHLKLHQDHSVTKADHLKLHQDHLKQRVITFKCSALSHSLIVIRNSLDENLSPSRLLSPSELLYWSADTSPVVRFVPLYRSPVILHHFTQCSTSLLTFDAPFLIAHVGATLLSSPVAGQLIIIPSS